MKTLNILMVMVAVISIASCTNKSTDSNTDSQQHQIETMSELIDSMSNRGMPLLRTLYFIEDSVGEYYVGMGTPNSPHIGRSHSISIGVDTTGVKDSSTLNHIFLLRTLPEVCEKLCEKAKKSSRYQSDDSLEYSLAMGNNPQELISMNKHKQKEKNKKEFQYIGFTYNVLKPCKKVIKSDDVKPVRELLKTFIGEQKNVYRYDVKYEWDKGVGIPKIMSFSSSECCLIWRWIGRDRDSLAASSVTGVHFFIPAKDKHRIDVAVDFYNRLNSFAIEHPQIGVELSTYAKLKSDMEKMHIESNRELLQYSVRNDETKRNIYNIRMEQSPEGIHILELYTPNAPRFVIPSNWYRVKRIHNLEIDYEVDFRR